MQKALLATSGNDIAGDIRLGFGGTDGVAILGLSRNQDGSVPANASVTYSGDIYLDRSTPTSGSGNMTSLVRLTAASGGRANFSGVIQDNASGTETAPVQILAAGAVALSGNNTYTGDTSVRAGTLLIGHDNAMGGAISDVSLGESQAVVNVDVATKASVGGTFSAGTYSGSLPTVIDGVTLTNGMKVLVKDETATERNGIYVVNSANNWTRDSALDSEADVVFGTQIRVAQGGSNGGQAFLLANRHGMAAGQFNVAGNSTESRGQIGFNTDILNPNVAILTDEAVNVSRNITVASNQSTGTSTLGGNSAHVSTFSGNVTLQRALQVTAAAGGTVDFAGDISGAWGLTKIGAGKVIFSTAKNYTGSTTVQEGILQVDGDLNAASVIVTGGTLQGTGYISGPTTIMAGATLHPGSSPGVLTVSNDVGLASGASFAVSLEGADAGSGYSQLLISGGTGDLVLGGATLDVTYAYSAGSSDALWIVRNDTAGTLTGEFAGLTNGATVSGTPFKIFYGADFDSSSLSGGNDVVLIVPEPATIGLVAAVGGLALVRRRRHA